MPIILYETSFASSYPYSVNAFLFVIGVVKRHFNRLLLDCTAASNLCGYKAAYYRANYSLERLFYGTR